MKFNSIRFKIGILYTAILGIILIVYSGILYYSLQYTLYNELNEELRSKAREIVRTIDAFRGILGSDQETLVFAARRIIRQEGEHPRQEQIAALEKRWQEKAVQTGLRNDYVNFLNSSGETIAASKNLQGKLHSLFVSRIEKAENKEETFRNVAIKKRKLRLINVPLAEPGLSDYILQIGTTMGPVINILQNRLVYIAVSIPVIVLVAGLASQFIVRRMLRPVIEITRTARKITHEDLSARVKAEKVEEEMRYLVDAFNDMISRLESSFRYIMEFSSQVAHELKSPLAIIRGESEIALRKEREPEEYRRALKVNLEETKRMLKLIENLLLLARLDYRTETFEFRKIELNEFLKEIYEQSKILANPKNITVKIEVPPGKVTIAGDRLHLRRLFFNLIDNAIKFTPRGGNIDLMLRCRAGHADVLLTDTGTGIAKKNLPKIFEKFYHLDLKEQSADSGSGLGLSIARSIARIHHGNIEVKSQPGKGSTFTVRLPLALSRINS